MIAWPDLDTSGAGGRRAAAAIWPTATPHLPGGAQPASAKPTPSRRQMTRRFWSVAAITVSAAVHAAAIYALAGFASPDGMEVETDAISVEIVVDQAIEAGSPGIAGHAPDTQDAASTAETQTRQAVEAQTSDRALSDDIAAPAVTDAANVDPEAPIDAEEPKDVASQEAGTALSDAEPVRAVDTPLVSSAENQSAVRVPDPFVAALREPPSFPSQVPELSVDLPPMDSKVAATLASPPPIQPTPIAPDKGDPVAAEPAPQAAPPAKAMPPKAAEPASADRKPKPQRQSTKTVDVGKKPPRNPPPSKKTAAAPNADKAKAAPGPKTADKASNRAASVAGNAPKTGASAGAEAKYARRIHGHVQRFRRYPQEAARAGTKGAVKVSVTIDRAGRLTAARIGKTSGHTVLDREAIATARRAAPYPRPPEGVGGATLDISFTLRFNG